MVVAFLYLLLPIYLFISTFLISLSFCLPPCYFVHKYVLYLPLVVFVLPSFILIFFFISSSHYLLIFVSLFLSLCLHSYYFICSQHIPSFMNKLVPPNLALLNKILEMDFEVPRISAWNV
jgi:hypothetical protein